MRYFRSVIYAGRRLYIKEYPTPAKGKNLFRPPRKAETTQKQKQLNDLYAARKMALLILCNFIPWRDLFFTLTFRKRMSEKDAAKALEEFLDYFRKEFKKQGKPFKYIWVKEKQSKWHFHIIMSEVPMSQIREAWKKYGDDIDISTLRPYDDYKGLTEYLVCENKPSRKKGTNGRNVKRPRRKGERRYSCSKNLDKPAVYEEEIKRISKSEPRPPKGYKLMEWTKWCDDMGFMHAEYGCIWCGAGPPPRAPLQKGGRKIAKN